MVSILGSERDEKDLRKVLAPEHYRRGHKKERSNFAV